MSRSHGWRLAVGCGLALTLVVGQPSAAVAHHSVAGEFDMATSVTLQGTIAKVDWINPHPYVHLEVRQTDGRTTVWALSTLPVPMLRKAGLTREALLGKRGETVTVAVMPARNGKPLGWITRITYSDGHYYRLFE
jgi:hypothetical protein